MTNKFITYSDLRGLRECTAFAQHTKSLHLCATNSLRTGIISCYQKPEETALIQGDILSSGMLFTKLLGRWSTPSEKMKQYTRLTRILADRAPAFAAPLRRAFRLNQKEVLQSMRSLTEIGLHPKSLNPRTDEEKLFVHLWSEMEKEDRGFTRIREQLQSPEWLQKHLGLAVDNVANREQTHQEIQEIVLHGFYFMTPLQYRIFTLIQQSGTRLVFLNLYNQGYPGTFASVDAFLAPWVPKQEWVHEDLPRPLSAWGDVFSSAYEEHRIAAAEDWRKPPVTSYTNFQSFLSNVSAKSKEEIYISPKHEYLNERLKEYFPEHYPDRHFLAYPIGQFLLHLHLMWDEERKELMVNDRGVFECFSSGWLQAENENARDYTEALRQVLLYYAGCETLKQWRERSEILLSVKEGAVEAFEHSANRFHQMMENPLLRFSFFSLSTYQLRMIIAFMEKLFALAELLFKSNSRTSIQNHFRKIETFLTEQADESTFYQEERHLLQLLIARLERDFDDDEAFYTEDLSQALALYLGGEFNDDEGEDEVEEARYLPVRRFDDADAIALWGKPVHLCGLDEESLPYTVSVMPWPLTKETLQSLTQHPEVSMFMIREEMSPYIARYLFYSLTAFTSRYQLSWIQQVEGKVLEESIYVMILGIKPKPATEEFEQHGPIEAAVGEGDLEQVADFLSQYPPDAAAEFTLCPRRFYYSFLAQPYARYTNDFHHQILYGNLLKAGYQLSDSPDDLVEKQVSALFPQWSDVRKRSLAEEAQIYKGTFRTSYLHFDGRDYVKGRKDFQFLISNYTTEEGFKLLDETNEAFQSGNVTRWLVEPALEENTPQMKAKPSEICRFCPHLNICDQGHYPVDDKLRALL